MPRIPPHKMNDPEPGHFDLTRVRPLKTISQCKICSHPERREIDEMIYRQRCRQKNDSGERITLNHVMAYLTEIGVPKPTYDNIKHHFSRHVEVPSDEVIFETNAAISSILAKLEVSDIATMKRADLLDVMMRQGVAEAGARLKTTGRSGITMEHVLKIAEIQIREKGSEAQNEFLKALGGGIVQAVKNGLPRKQIEEGEVIDAEPVGEEEVAA